MAILPIKSWSKRIPLYVGAGVIGLVAVLVLQPGDSNVASEVEAQSLIASGNPVFVELFSNNCSACLASQPIVRSLEDEMPADTEILKLNVQDTHARMFIREYKAYLTPTFVVLGRDGEVIWRQSGGLLNKGAALEALESA